MLFIKLRPDRTRERGLIIASSAELADGLRGGGRESLCIVLLEEEARDFVSFRINQRLGEEALQRDVGERDPRGDARLLALRGDSGEAIAGAIGAGAR